MARRFIVAESEITALDNHLISIAGKEVKHIQVLRHQVGDIITVNEINGVIVKMTRDKVVLQVLELAVKQGEPAIDITLYQAILKADKMDFVIQKAVELGVKKIVPFFSQNVVVKLDEKAQRNKKEKWQMVANEACKQCGRTDSVMIEPIYSFVKVIGRIKQDSTVLFAYEKETKKLQKVLHQLKEKELGSISMIIGAEGGFEEKEADMLRAQEQVISISLGTRILRAETASLSLLSVLGYEFES